ncbi:MAG: hypothetical protein HOL08_07935 [Opitutae bacterium]|jgi:hypothetical protein|nr:hypothetical protein [Opitutae bacterium]
MTLEKIKYISVATLDKLSENVEDNIARYQNGDFQDMVKAGGWSIELEKKVALDEFDDLDASGGTEVEIKNSLLVWRALGPLTPSLACEERIWTRLAHVECLEYSRERWLGQDVKEKLVNAIKTHFFAKTRTMTRDDNAVGRLWWNAHIANLAMPGDQERALGLILEKADIRSNFIERSRTVSRPPIAAGIIRTMAKVPWVTDTEENYRYLMRTLNKYGGGVMFELMTVSEIDGFMTDCVEKAKVLQASEAT